MGNPISMEAAPPQGSSAPTGGGVSTTRPTAQTGRSQAPGAGSADSKEHAAREAVKILGARDSSQDRLEVTVDEQAGVIVRIVDGEGRTIRQIPPEEMVALARRLDEVIGLLFDRKV